MTNATLISREGFVWRDGQPLQKGLESDAVLPDSATFDEEYDVIIVGAGFAGMIAARELSSRYKVLLLDARDRIGGRTWVAKVDGQEFEMGGMWVHWYQTFLWSEICRYGLLGNVTTASGTTAPESSYFNNCGNLETITDLESAAAKIDGLVERFLSIDGLTLKDYIPRPFDNFYKSELFEKYDKLGAQERIDQMNLSPTDKVLLETSISNLSLTTAGQVGFGEAAHWFALGGTKLDEIAETMGTFKLKNGGMTTLAKAIIEDFHGDRLFNAPVKRITDLENGGGVGVELSSGRLFKAKYAICTAPLNVMKDLEFSPPLSPLRQEAVNIGHPGRGGKIHYIVSPPVPAFTSSSTAPTELTFLFTDHDNTTHDTTYLVSFVHSDSKLRDFTNDEQVKVAFKAMLPVETNVKSYVYHDWRSDPYAQGTWCCYDAAFASKYLRELQSPHMRRVFMASADWANGWRGCIDGAMEQGLINAQAVKELLKQEAQLQENTKDFNQLGEINGINGEKKSNGASLGTGEHQHEKVSLTLNNFD